VLRWDWSTCLDRSASHVLPPYSPVESTKSISGARPHPNPRCRDAIREQIAAP